ncbi:MAG: hypothetical protein ACI9UK_001635 [Candidatus Krumholzibacteriia bacterium]
MRKLFLIIILMLVHATAWAHGISEADQLDMIGGGYLKYIELGAEHMVTGYDHLLFLLGVVFFLTTFREIAKFITAFTIGHSITLVFATFMGISANYFLVDAVIALTVVYKGFDNLGGFQKIFKTSSPNLIVLVFSFGLIHGFGLSTRLQQLPLGEDGLLLRILSFNLGVELGQIAALTVMLFILNMWRRTSSFARFSTAVNFGLVVAGFALFAFQMTGYFTADDSVANPVGIEEAKDSMGEWRDSILVTIPAESGVEYKFGVNEGETLEFAWTTDGEALYYDFHGEAHDANDDEFTSFEEATSAASSGSQLAPFTGRMGWYWQNDTNAPVVITLRARGQYHIIDQH